MQSIPIQIAPHFTTGILQFGLPLVQGQVFSLAQLQCSLQGKILDASAKECTQWQDGSIRSCTLYVYIDTTEHHDQLMVTITPEVATSPTAPSIPEVIDNLSTHLRYDSENLIFEYDLAAHTFTFSGPKTATSQQGQVRFFDKTKAEASVNVNRAVVTPLVPLSTTHTAVTEMQIDGSYLDQSQQVIAQFYLTLRFFASGGFCQINHRLHNPKRAIHSNGHWDLGDPNSLLFSELSFEFECPQEQSFMVQIDEKNRLSSADINTLHIEQYSSGGDNWQSPVHVGADNTIPLQQQGYIASHGEQSVATGRRAQPIAQMSQWMQLTVKQFWQRFPTALTLSSAQTKASLFPSQSTGLHELQGGEQSSQELVLSFDQTSPNALQWAHQTNSCAVDKAYLARTFLSSSIDFSQAHSQWQQHYTLGLESEANFLQKRETLDEFGWRNFGDLYADHETAEHKGDDLFVSHYNNQYDPLWGFLKQYLATGEHTWLALADDLAKHVIDIDIYHTSEDKAEYNGGLFWHTDHYVQAYTSSHRSYSKLQPSDVYQDHAGGGGPGGQHCYTAGLTLYYALTGHEPAKQAVLTLSHWIGHVYEGSGTCLELLLAFKNRHQAGFKNPFTGQYPLDRGTANYINALLDSYELTLEPEYLSRAEHIFTHTFHPTEDVNQRNLDDVEGTWFYTVLLQSICKYLSIKLDNNQLDEAFYYCRDTLLNYARWMLVNEGLYLDKPEILEYPNDTWTAQDLRKVHIFAAAHYFSNAEHSAFLDKARELETGILTRLSASSTKTYTRIMVLVLQNAGAIEVYQQLPKIQFAAPIFTWPAPRYQQRSNFTGLISEGFKRLFRLSISAEIDWLKKRLG